MDYIRAFISIELPDNVRSDLQKLQEDFKRSFPRFRWVSVNSVHLTLKFLGNVAPDQIEPIKKDLGKIAEEHPAFRLSLKDTGLFPNMRRPRVVWVGLGENIDALSQVQKHIDSALTPLGFPPEKRDFTPHLTLARVPEGMRPDELEEFGKQWTAVKFAGGRYFEAKGINLMKSTLKPTGAVYDVLASFPLRSI